MNIEDVMRIAMDVAISSYTMIERPVHVSVKQAKKKYKGLLKQWDGRGMLTHVPTANGKTYYYVGQELDVLWSHHLREKRGEILD